MICIKFCVFRYKHMSAIYKDMSEKSKIKMTKKHLLNNKDKLK